MISIWNSINTCLKEHLSEPGFQTFMSSASPKSFENDILTIEVSNAFSREWIKEKCEPILKTHFLETDLKNILFHYEISQKEQPEPQLDLLTYYPSKPNAQNAVTNFNEKYTFDNFVVGHNNRFAHAASEAVSKAPAKAYNPLFIYGSVGLGKTHLLHAIGLEIKRKNPKAKVDLVSSEKFTNELINAIKDKKMEAFRTKYRTLDVLLVDDIQFLAGKEQTQEEFFHTFNDLHSNNKQIVLTSDRPPKEIPTLEVRLRTRFEWGLIADIQPPELETRIAILRKKIELNHFSVTDDILHYIATQIPSNVREMEGALTRIVAYASLLNTEVTLSIASNVIRDMVGIKQEKPLSINHIKRKVCDYFNITNSELCSKDRSKDIAFPRQIAMYLARELTNVSLPKIGENFGNRDHSTVMHACDKIKSMLQNDSDTKSIVTVLISNIRNDD
jgi:chromosomal replication initiator protein